MIIDAPFNTVVKALLFLGVSIRTCKSESTRKVGLFDVNNISRYYNADEIPKTLKRDLGMLCSSNEPSDVESNTRGSTLQSLSHVPFDRQTGASEMPCKAPGRQW